MTSYKSDSLYCLTSTTTSYLITSNTPVSIPTGLHCCYQSFRYPPPRPVDELWRDIKHRSPRSLSLHGSGLSLHLSVGTGFMRTVDNRSPRMRYALLPMLLRISFLLRSPLVLSLVDCTWSLSALSELLMWVMGSERTPSFLPACGHGSIVIWIHALICSCHAPAPLLSSAHHQQRQDQDPGQGGLSPWAHRA